MQICCVDMWHSYSYYARAQQSWACATPEQRISRMKQEVQFSGTTRGVTLSALSANGIDQSDLVWSRCRTSPIRPTHSTRTRLKSRIRIYKVCTTQRVLHLLYEIMYQSLKETDRWRKLRRAIDAREP